MLGYWLVVLSIVAIEVVGLLLVWRLTRAESTGVRVVLRSVVVALLVFTCIAAYMVRLAMTV